MQRTVKQGSVDLDARTLTAIVATKASRLVAFWDGEAGRDVTVEEEVVLVEGMDLTPVETLQGDAFARIALQRRP